MSTMGRKIAGARIEAGLMQEQLGEAAGVTKSAVQQWEADRTRPRVNKLKLIAEAVGKPVSYFLTDEPGEDSRAGEISPELVELRELRKQIARITGVDLSADDPPPGVTQPGVWELLDDERLCETLGVTAEERVWLGGDWPVPGGIQTMQEAIQALNFIRSVMGGRK